ncbi:hypothetical protein JCGZ_03565 [Jatropha curcas]|uniref:Large ribosomal subunit protein uL13c n=1 Tax=Jatropha curcas TaxID=180498 RepID=A0A067L1A7_JATCU|nr:50S ribosomal protein L13, chloroplastic [Jatropha curcas]KDP41033.1 hypothetical protein JCGZ_03565 [Jatropha curcas]
MALLCAQSPAMLLSSASSSSSTTPSAPKSYFSCARKDAICCSPFTVGFSLVKKPCVRTEFPFSSWSSSNFVVRSQKKKEETAIARVPLDQRWMFEENEINGPDIWNKTWYPKAADHINTDKPWYVVDATDKILGRLASTIAIYIRGKNLATYTPSVDMGAFVIVVNAEKVAVSGKKRTQKLYRRHSGRPGGMKVETFDQLQQRIPERIIEHAVRGMLPKGRLGRALFNHLKVYKGPDHPHEAQKPVELPIRDKRIQKEG